MIESKRWGRWIEKMTKQQKLANEIYEYLLNDNKYNSRIAELKWVVNLTNTDTAIMVIQVWLADNSHIESLDDYDEYVTDKGC